jgi:diguanylate cyclase (GGDEF)-like protein
MGQLADSLRERESLMELLRRQALYDSLTGLANRSLFNEHLAKSFVTRASDGLLAVLLIDLDDFKAVNDTYGHDTGDALLITVGERIRACIRSGDTAARLGGDEFVVILRGCADRDIPVRIGERVLTALGEPYALAGQVVRARASIGLAVAGPVELVPEDLTRNADIAMYLAKERGKGRLEVHEPGMQAAAVTNLQVRSDLEAGIAAGNLRLHYQPVVDLRSGRTLGREALVRWQRGDELVSPADFIPVAETSGLIDQLTDWVLDEACRTANGWQATVERTWVSVNLSSSQLLRRDLIERILATLETTGLAADRLVLEITESSILDIDVARPAIERLHQIGVRIAIDDFGTGYSALSYLAQLPVDFLKIDRSFVAALEHAGPEEAIAAAIVDLARRLDLTTIAEGIETSSQLRRLASLGCDLGQGYHIARPAPDATFGVALTGRAAMVQLHALRRVPA